MLFQSISLKPLASARISTTSNAWSTVPNLMVPLSWHCMSQMDSLTVVVTGGYTTSTSTVAVGNPKSYFYNLFTKVWSNGPNLLTNRGDHGCSFIAGRDGKPTAIIAGGYFNGRMKSVEIYDRVLNAWQSGPDLPLYLNAFQVIFL